MSGALEAFKGERYLNLETFKKDGNGVKTPVWFVEFGERLWVYSDGNAYKVKRVGRNPKARFAACDMRGGVHGEWFDGTAAIIADEKLRQQFSDEMQKKYGWQYSMITIGAKFSGSIKRRTVICLQPA